MSIGSQPCILPPAPYTIVVRRLIFLLLLACSLHPAWGQTVPSSGQDAPALAGQALVNRALANELAAAQDASQPMRYQLRKTSPRLTTTKEIVETSGGAVARLVAVDDQPLSAARESAEEARLHALLADPARQRHRKLAEDDDAARAVKVLRALPSAFLYQDAGPADSAAGKVEKFTFRPNPAFSPPSLETEVLPAMRGEIWIDPARQRVARLEAHLQQDVDFGWGILGRLYKGGWIEIDQAPVGQGQWRTTRFQMRMSGRIVVKTRVFDTTEWQTGYAPVPVGLTYQKAIDMLLDGK